MRQYKSAIIIDMLNKTSLETETFSIIEIFKPPDTNTFYGFVD